jgi:predicted outer membrane protein
LRWVIKEHRSGVPLFENQVNMGKDDDVRAFAKANLATSRKHLQEAEDLAKTISPK